MTHKTELRVTIISSSPYHIAFRINFTHVAFKWQLLKPYILPDHSDMSSVSVSVISAFSPFISAMFHLWTCPKCFHWYLDLWMFALSSGFCSEDKGQVHCQTKVLKVPPVSLEMLYGHFKMHPQPLFCCGSSIELQWWCNPSQFCAQWPHRNTKNPWMLWHFNSHVFTLTYRIYML